MPEEEIIRTRPTMHGYLASRLSDHISEMPDGSLLVVGCPVARTGFQEYAVRDLPQEAARDLGVDVSNPSSLIDLYRPPGEVFSPRFLASLNGRPITDGHPPDFVNTSNFTEYAKGHGQEPRRGPAMEDGEQPVLVDLIISGEPLVSKVKSKQARDISLGYDFSIDKDGDKIIQCDMLANHIAIVPKGRAGDLIAIGDAAPSEIHPRAAPPEPEALLVRPPGSGDGPSASNVNATPTKKREKPNVKNNILHMLGLGLRARAADADTDPEELAQAALDMHEVVAKDKRNKDGLDPDIEETTQVADKRRGKDLDPEIEETQTNDRKGIHDALDKIMNAMDGKRGRDRHADDADIAALRDLLNDYLGEEEQEPEHADTGDDDLGGEEPDPTELEEVVASDEPDPELAGPDGEEDVIADEDPAEMECAHCQTVMDGAEACPACGCKDAKAKDKGKARDRATAHDGAAATLRMLRPAIARCKDEGVKAFYNTALAALRRGSKVRAADAGYGSFRRAARTASKDRPANYNRTQAADSRAADVNNTAQAVYDQLRAGKAAK